jgi:hypothetical protein
VFPHTTSAYHRRRGYYKRPLIQSEIRKQRWNFSCSSYRCGFHPVRTEHTADCVCWVHTRSNEAAESVKRIDQSASACILNTVTGRFDLTTRSAALPSSRRRSLERCFKPEIVNRLPTLSMIRKTPLSRCSGRCWQFQRHRFACCWSTRWHPRWPRSVPHKTRTGGWTYHRARSCRSRYYRQRQVLCHTAGHRRLRWPLSHRCPHPRRR